MPVKRSALLFILFLHIGCMQNDNDTEPKPEHYRERVAEALEKASYAQESEAEALRQAAEWRVRYGEPTLEEQYQKYQDAYNEWTKKRLERREKQRYFFDYRTDEILHPQPKEWQFVRKNDWDRAAEEWAQSARMWEYAAEEWNAAAVALELFLGTVGKIQSMNMQELMSEDGNEYSTEADEYLKMMNEAVVYAIDIKQEADSLKKEAIRLQAQAKLDKELNTWELEAIP